MSCNGGTSTNCMQTRGQIKDYWVVNYFYFYVALSFNFYRLPLLKLPWYKNHCKTAYRYISGFLLKGPKNSTVLSLILTLDHRLSGVAHVLPVITLVSAGFSGFLTPFQSILVGGLAMLNWPLALSLALITKTSFCE